MNKSLKLIVGLFFLIIGYHYVKDYLVKQKLSFDLLLLAS